MWYTLYSTIHIPWRRKERGGELIIQLSTTPSVRDDGSSVWGRLNNTIISTFVLGLQEELKIIQRERCRILPLRVTCTRRCGPFRNNNGVGRRRECRVFSFVTPLVPSFWLGLSVLGVSLGVSLSKRSTTSFGWFSKVLSICTVSFPFLSFLQPSLCR